MNEVSVVFRKEKDGAVIALFPYVIENNADYLISCYSHNGQHSMADYDAVIKDSSKATERDYKGLADELRFLGYELKIIDKANRRKMELAFSDSSVLA